MATFPPPPGAPPRQSNTQTAPAANPAVPPGTFAPGTKVQVGKHRVIIERYLSEGGFAHVYVVHVPTSSGKSAAAVLKRVAVPDKETLAEMRTEVETMKRLKGHRQIVTYIDSHASGLKNGGYEVFLLMEYCDGGGLIDFMNTRLKNRLTEPEILKIISDAAQGVAAMHYLKPPLLHRDLKVENILITNTSSGKEYKLCDFGSSAPPRPAATSAAEGRLIEEDVQRHTTFQYRSPEMIDVYRKRPIDEKSDIWALGVLLYKLCYYTTPFEDQGQMAILSASFKYPPQPRFSDRLKLLIATMLSEDPQKRPNIYQVISQICAMREKQVPIKDIYSSRTASEARNNQQLPPKELQVQSPPMVGAYKAPVEQPKQVLPEITPMRRGRPTAATSQQKSTTTKSDPFAALDSKNLDTRSKAASAKYPALGEFSLLQTKDSKFNFDQGKDGTLNKRLTNALADEAFAGARGPSQNVGADVARQASLKASKATGTDTMETAKSPAMVSTGTMTSPTVSQKDDTKALNSREIWRVPASKTRNLEPLLVRDSTDAYSSHGLDGTSQRKSMEGGRPSMLEVARSTHRSKSAETQHRASTGEEPDVRGRTTAERPHSAFMDDASLNGEGDEEDIIPSNIDFLRAMEEEDGNKGHHRRHSSLHRFKHNSVPLSGARRNLLSGKFGEAFRRFDMNAGNRTPSPNPATLDSESGDVEAPLEDEPSDLRVDDLEEEEELSPEVRRELERRRLSQEERRVAEAQAAYRNQLARGTSGRGVTRASTIQNRVKNLLDDGGRASPVQRTAEGYGRYTDATTFKSPSPAPSLPVADISIAPPASAPPTTTPRRTVPLQSSRPAAPPKPLALRTGSTTATQSPVEARSLDLPGEEWETDFSKRYPSLSLEMVETEIAKGDAPSRPLRVKDV